MSRGLIDRCHFSVLQRRADRAANALAKPVGSLIQLGEARVTPMNLGTRPCRACAVTSERH